MESLKDFKERSSFKYKNIPFYVIGDRKTHTVDVNLALQEISSIWMEKITDIICYDMDVKENIAMPIHDICLFASNSYFTIFSACIADKVLICADSRGEDFSFLEEQFSSKLSSIFIDNEEETRDESEEEIRDKKERFTEQKSSDAPSISGIFKVAKTGKDGKVIVTPIGQKKPTNFTI